jgi:putative membrane protein
MINYIFRLVACGLAVYFLPRYLNGIAIDTLTTAMLVAVVMSILNGFVKPILKLISFPITIITLGLFSFVITVLIVYLCDYLVDGFKVTGFLPPLLFSFALSAVNWVVGLFQD